MAFQFPLPSPLAQRILLTLILTASPLALLQADEGTKGTEGKQSEPKPAAGGKEITAFFTAYYIATVETDYSKGDRKVEAVALTGKKHHFYLNNEDFAAAEREAVVSGKDAKGNVRAAYRISEGKWKELPKGALAFGSRMNPLVPFRHVAANQKIYPFGSMLFYPDAVGLETPAGYVSDGYFWVGDTGGAVNKTSHFDLFVGPDEIYRTTAKKLKNHKDVAVTVYPLPKYPKGLEADTFEGRKAILEGTGDLKAGVTQMEALIAFQKRHDKIPEAEHGYATGAATRWFLTQSALEISDRKKQD